MNRNSNTVALFLAIIEALLEIDLGRAYTQTHETLKAAFLIGLEELIDDLNTPPHQREEAEKKLDSIYEAER